MGTTTNQPFKVVLAHREKPLAYVAMIDGKKMFLWDKSFMDCPAHGDIEFFMEEIYIAISELMEFPHGWLKVPRWERMIEHLIFALNEWPNEEGLLIITSNMIKESTKDYVQLMGAEKL